MNMDVALACRNNNIQQQQQQPIDLVSAVKELHMLTSEELSKLIRDANNDIIHWTAHDGSSKQINVETLARYLTCHLLAKLLESKRDEQLFRYLLAGLRLLHALCDIAPRNSKLEQVLLEDVKISEQIFDLIFFVILVLSGFRQESGLVLLHSATLACSLYLLTAFVSTQWNELALVLLAHPKVDIFVFGAFSAVHRDIQFLQVRLSGQYSNTAEIKGLCQHCEASLQFLQSLCQQRFFRERLVKNKDVCEEGGILLLAYDIMKLPFCEESSSYLMAVVSRLKSKVLSILLHLCEVESVSFLDVAASTSRGLNLAKSTIFQVLELLRTMFRGDLNAALSDNTTYPRGLLQLNAMRLTDILSDDSNFRSYITLNFTEVLTTIFLQPHAEFLSSWCSSESEEEEDATLDYDPLSASGWVLGVLTSSDVPESTFNASPVPPTSYAFQRTSLLVKVVANLTCFIPDLCKEEKDLFVSTFLQCLQKELPNLPYGVPNDSRTERVANITQNLRSLFIHAESLVPGFLNQDDVQLFRLFIAQLEPLITQEFSIARVTEANSPLEESNQLNIYGPQTFSGRGVHESDGDAQNVETNGLMQFRKRKRNIMNHLQISMIEQALQNEPDMQRKSASLQLWAEKISLHGSELSSSQLKNWLNNRKAKLARAAAAKDIRAAASSGGDRQGGSGTDPDPDEFFDQGVRYEAGQIVGLRDGEGEEIGKGCVQQARGSWCGTNLDESGLCVVDVTYLKVDKWSNLPHPCDATGTSFAHSEQITGVKRVLWDSSKLVPQPKSR
ncbi:putative nodulin homeobox protein [Helianthus annuus]|nr:putative nodulin homeobox protein [Helianthus annuus]